MFNYQSGAGLHVGHPLGYIASDIVARFKQQNGYNVLHPMGYDSFGLPAEQYAIQTGQHPAVTTKVNIEGGKDLQGKTITGYANQLKKIGLAYDWNRELRTSDPDFYKWTHQILLNYRLTYLADAEVNWCPALGTVLANDEIVNGVSERGGHPVVRKKMKQWMMRISAYADRLLSDLETIDWPLPIKEIQSNWIGKSKGAKVFFEVENSKQKIEVFTTRPDTLFGVSFITLAPEHEWVDELTQDSHQEKIKAYKIAAAKKSERERMADVKSISGAFTGSFAVNPISKLRIPIWISDYVLAGYGTGAVMAVPCGDERDYRFAKHFDLAIPNIFDKDISENAFTEKTDFKLIDSDFLTGLDYKNATEKIIKKLQETGAGAGTTNYRLRDAVFSRQRYWGEPIPMFHNAGIPHPIPTESLPLRLPEIDAYLPTEDGTPPLGRAEQWAWDSTKNEVVENSKIDNKTIFALELNTMPGWAGSSWYFHRYKDSKNPTEIAAKDNLDYWGQVDLYLGGSEHATGHLLYARFWQKFLFDINKVTHPEFAKKLINQGMILGYSAIIYRKHGSETYVSAAQKDGQNVDPIRIDVNCLLSETEVDLEKLKSLWPAFKNAHFELSDGVFLCDREVEKMSKRWHNVVNPDDICEEYGADSLRLYEMFLGPLEQSKPWNTQGLSGVHGFLKKYWKLFHSNESFEITDEKPNEEELRILHKTLQKVAQDIEQLSLNTSVSSFMIAVNELQKLKCTKREILEPLTIALSAFAPHITEEIWEKLGHKE
eukprot:maker-scaffold1928_size24841-snap-gene-0.0 protein:Tk04210 transcript:maker-scaffold1928_size24841-snap-gene-0.0-mRNA-1 annotation:"leucyl-trna synthetase"